MFGFLKFGTCLHTFIVKQSLMNKLCTAGLDCEVILSKSNFRFSWIAVLSHKIAGVASQHHIIYLALRAGANRNHFADVSKMVRDILSGIPSRFLSLFYNGLKVTPLDVAHYRRKFPGTPALNAFIFVGNGFKTVE